MLGWAMTTGGVTTCHASDKSDQAGKLFDEATRAFARKEFERAARAFMSAHELMPHAATAYNAAKAWESAGDKPRAAEAFAMALRMGGLNATQARDADKRLAALKADLTLVTVRAPNGAKITAGHVVDAPTPLEVFLPRGHNRIFATLDSGAVISRDMEAIESEATIEISAPPQQSTGKESETRGETVPEANGGIRGTLGWVALGTGVAAAGAAVFLGVKALSARDQFNDSNYSDQDAHDRASSYRTWTNVAWAAAGVLTVSGLVLVLTAPRTKANSQAAARPQVWISWAMAPGSVGLMGGW
jgi:hypothetical protein